ncbi:MAG: response regulator [Sutterella sp.]|nr:response regulator [Sutterella sp.]
MTEPLIRIVDDDAAVLEGLAFILEGEGWKVRTYDSAEKFLREDAPSVPGCLILDINMPGMNGLDLQRTMRDRGYGLPIIFLTGHGDIDVAISTIRLGAVEFLQKTCDNDRLISAVRDAVARSRAGFADVAADPYDAIRLVQRLTERELFIAKRISSGLLNRQIAERLGISVRTVEAHRLAVFRKLEIKSVSELTTLLTMAGN